MMRWINKNQGHWMAKILSLLGAILLWFFVMKEQNPIVDINYTVPVQMQNLNSQYVVENIPSEVHIHFRGPRNSILAINQSTLKAYMDMGDVAPGQQNVQIQFTPPSGVSLISMTPDTVNVNVDEYTLREVPVEVQQLGKVPEDVAIKAINTVPKVVTVSGAKQEVDSVAHVVLRVKMNDRRADFTASGMMVAVNAAGKTVDKVTITPRQGQAQIDLEQIRFEKNLPAVANLTGTLDSEYAVKSVTVEPQQVLVSGKEGAIKDLTEVRTIDIPLNGQVANIEGDYDLVPNENYSITPARVHVIVEIVKKYLGDANAKNN